MLRISHIEVLEFSASAHGAGQDEGKITPLVVNVPRIDRRGEVRRDRCVQHFWGRFWVWGLVGRGTYCKLSANHFNWQSLVVTRDSEAVNSGQYPLSFARPDHHRAFTGQAEVANKRPGAGYSQ
jgi:hypothetical protein